MMDYFEYLRDFNILELDNEERARKTKPYKTRI